MAERIVIQPGERRLTNRKRHVIVAAEHIASDGPRGGKVSFYFSHEGPRDFQQQMSLTRWLSYEIVPEVHEVSWALAKAPRRAIIGKSSKRHYVIGGNSHALCGAKIPWLRTHASNEGDCRRCHESMAQMMVAE